MFYKILFYAVVEVNERRERKMEARKQYVDVVVMFREDGRMLPRQILWEDGRRFPVDRIIDITPAPALLAGGQGDRYTVRVAGKLCYLFFEHSCDMDSDRPGRWFVEAVK